MRALWIGIALLASSASALASGVHVAPGRIIPDATSDIGGGDIPTVNRGEQFAIACDEIKSDGDVRVVLSLSAIERAAGYTAILATNQKVVRHAVQVQVPNLPDIGGRTVNVKVYVTDSKGTKACDAGRVHIG